MSLSDGNDDDLGIDDAGDMRDQILARLRDPEPIPFTNDGIVMVQQAFERAVAGTHDRHIGPWTEQAFVERQLRRVCMGAHMERGECVLDGGHEGPHRWRLHFRERKPRNNLRNNWFADTNFYPSVARGRAVRVGGRRLDRHTLGRLAELYAPRPPGYTHNRHDSVRWTRAFRDVCAVASDALLGGQRVRAIGVLVEMIGLDDAIKLTLPTPRWSDYVQIRIDYSAASSRMRYVGTVIGPAPMRFIGDSAALEPIRGHRADMLIVDDPMSAVDVLDVLAPQVSPDRDIADAQ